ncbi:MAG TPA: hypothetical protein VFR21_12295 [Bradyrhizobium sp.]|nr:hypothetical protein [Bradyrhizobium sp.]
MTTGHVLFTISCAAPRSPRGVLPRAIDCERFRARHARFDAQATLRYLGGAGSPVELAHAMKTYKIVVFVPESAGKAVRTAMGEAGAGRIGNYACCSFTTKGIGRFRPVEGADPAIGEVGQRAEVIEERIEMICSESHLKAVLAAIRRVHPYEEPAIDFYPLAVTD